MLRRGLMLVIIVLGAAFEVCGQQQPEKFGGGTASGFFRRGIPFALEAQSSTRSVCEGGQVKFSASSAGIAYASCRWYKVGKSEAVGKDTAYYLNPVSMQDTGTYYCEFTDLIGNVTVRSDDFKLEVRPLPVVTVPADTVICYGDTVRLQAAVEQDQCTFVWKGMEIIGDKTADAVDVAPLQARQYVVEVTRLECKTMDTVEVSINDTRVVLPELYYSSEGVPSEIAALDTAGNLLPAEGLKWYEDGNTIAERVNPLSKAYDHSTILRAENTSGSCQSTAQVQIVVKAGGSFGGGRDDGFARTGINFSIWTRVTPEVVCEGESALLEAGTTGLDKYTYRWYKAGDPEVRSDTSVLFLDSLTVIDGGRYYCVIEDEQKRGTQSDTVSLTVKPSPVVKIKEAEISICLGDTVVLHATSSLSDGSNLWTGDAIAGEANRDSVVVAPTGRQDYVFTAANDGCVDADTVTVEVNDSRVFLPEFYYSTEGVPSEIAALDANGNLLPAEGLQWYEDGNKITQTANPLVTELHQDALIRAEYTKGHCTSSQETQVVVKVNTSFGGGRDDGFAQTGINFSIWTRVTPEVVCEGESALLEAGTTGLDKYTYRWYKTGDPAVRSDTSVLLLNSLKVADAGQYYCVVEDEQKRGTQSDTVSLTVKPSPVVKIKEAEISICLGDTVVLHATSSLSDGSNLWTGDAIAGEANRDSVVVAPTGRQDYVFTAANDGCVDADTVTVEVNDSRVFLPEFYYSSEGVPSEIAALDANGNLLPVEGLKWYEDETLVAVRVNPFSKTYDHNTILQAENTSGTCQSTAQVQIVVKSRNTVMGGSGDGFVQTDTSPYRSRLLAVTGSGEYCPGDTASVKLTLIRGEAPWTTVIKRVSDRQEANEICMTYPLKVYGKDTVLRFPVYATEIYLADTIPGDILSAGATTKLRIDMKETDHIEFRTGWPSAFGQCQDVSLYDSLAPMLNGLPLTLDQVNFYMDGEVLPGGFWPRQQLRAGAHIIYCEYTGPGVCAILSDEIRFRVDTLPRATLEMPEWACGDTVALLKIAGEVQQVYVAEMAHHYYMQGGGVREGQRLLTIPGTGKGVYEIPLKQSLVTPRDSAVVFEVGRVTDSHGCSIEHALRDTLFWRVRPVLDLQVQYPGSSEWVAAPEREITFQGREQVGVKAALQEGQAPWQLIENDVASAWINRTDTTFRLDQEGEYRYRVGDAYCGENTLAEQKLKLVYRDTGFFRGGLWLEGAYRTAVRIMESEISGLLRASYGLAAWPSTIAPVIDRVEVELREAPSAHSAARKDENCRIICRDTCLLLANGQLADYHNGDTLVALRNAYCAGNEGYYMVVFHRNHLAVMSKEPVQMVNGPEKQHAIRIDFSKAENIYYSGGSDLKRHMTLTDGKYMLSVGDFNSNLLVSLFDENEIKALFTPGAAQEIPVTPDANYLLLDVNFDGKIRKQTFPEDISDWLLMKRSRGKYTEIKY